MRRGVEIAAIYVERKLLKVFAKGFYVENKTEEICPEGGDNVQITEGNKKTIKLTEMDGPDQKEVKALVKELMRQPLIGMVGLRVLRCHK